MSKINLTIPCPNPDCKESKLFLVHPRSTICACLTCGKAYEYPSMKLFELNHIEGDQNGQQTVHQIQN